MLASSYLLKIQGENITKVKALKQKQDDKKIRLIALMISPLVIALAYLLFSPANAWGQDGDHRLKRNPGTQGWDQLQYLDVNFGDSQTETTDEDAKH